MKTNTYAALAIAVALSAFAGSPVLAANSIGGESAHVAHKPNDCVGQRWNKNYDENGDTFDSRQECRDYVRDHRRDPH